MKNIIITGASRGIGRDTALQLAKDGHRVLALSRNEAALKVLQEEAGDNLHYLAYDITSPDARPLLEIVEPWGTVDVLINNAGYLLNKPFHETTGTDWENVMSVNFHGPVHLLQMLRPFLTECLAEEWKESGVCVNCLALGAVQTEMLAAAFPGMQAPVSSEQMGGLLSYCALQGHHFFNGKVLPVSVSTP